MPYALMGLVAVVLLIMAGKKLVQANPAQLAPILQRTVAGGIIALAVFLTLRGALPIAVPLFLVGLGMLGLGNPLGRFGFPWGQRSPGQKSAVRTSMLAMELDHDTGAMNGTVLAGSLAGRALNDLDEAALQGLYQECATADADGVRLLEAYFDRRFPGWREHADRDADARAGARPQTGAMTEQEAYQVLGLEPGASAEAVRRAHRTLMMKLHPDQGGSTYLAARVNQAKEILLDRHR